MTIKSAAYAVQSVAKSKWHIYIKRALGGKIVLTLWKAFIDAVFKTSCNLANSQKIVVLNVVNGRCPGCDLSNPVETL